MTILISLTLLLGLLGGSCHRAKDEHIEKISPNGNYAVKVAISELPPKGTRDQTEAVTISLFKGEELLYERKTEQSSQYEPSFRDIAPVIEWVNGSTLRMGEDTSDQSFRDKLIVSNETGQPLRYVSVSYGKYESFFLFDLPPNDEAILLASPRFKPDGSSNYFVGYGGKSESGKVFEGTMETKPRQSVSEGPKEIRVTIHTNDLR